MQPKTGIYIFFCMFNKAALIDEENSAYQMDLSPTCSRDIEQIKKPYKRATGKLSFLEITLKKLRWK